MPQHRETLATALVLGVDISRWAIRRTLNTILDLPYRLPADIQAEVPITNATIGAQYVHIGNKLTTQLQSQPNDGELDQEASALRLYGYTKIAEAVLQADTSPLSPDEVTRKTARIAISAGTDPMRLMPNQLSEISARRISSIMAEHR